MSTSGQFNSDAAWGQSAKYGAGSLDSIKFDRSEDAMVMRLILIENDMEMSARGEAKYILFALFLMGYAPSSFPFVEK
ncbi:hypothetical protein [Chromobacterium subtsugae]|uniref:hypothetical protein n=1 Tax=Chromobacterium subtsugae TaxID=251747 RepID=UPI0012FF9305|nr:hypothetical protein [Chromobacterium subtsugae]